MYAHKFQKSRQNVLSALDSLNLVPDIVRCINKKARGFVIIFLSISKQITVFAAAGTLEAVAKGQRRYPGVWGRRLRDATGVIVSIFGLDSWKVHDHGVCWPWQKDRMVSIVHAST